MVASCVFAGYSSCSAMAVNGVSPLFPFILSFRPISHFECLKHQSKYIMPLLKKQGMYEEYRTNGKMKKKKEVQ